MNMRNKINRNISGVTLIELMIALAVTSILMIGVGSIYGNSKKTYSIDEEFAHLQENARIAMKYVVEDIRMAGYIGCAWNNGEASKFQCFLNAAGGYVCNNATTATGIEGFDAINTIANDSTAEEMTLTGSTLTVGTGAIAGWSNNWINNSGGATQNIPNEFPAAARRPIFASDILIVRHAGGPGIALTAAQTNDDFTISSGTPAVAIGADTCHAPTGFCENDILIATDCNKARVFQVTDITDPAAGSLLIEHDDAAITPGNAAPVAWGGGGDTDNQFIEGETEIMKFRTYAYYVANNISDEPALYRHDGIQNSAPEELVEGIENLQLLYGVDVDGDGRANRYTSADTIDFASTTDTVVSVRISMLVRTKEEIPTRPVRTNTYNMATTAITAIEDKRLRKTFTSTIKIRNKGL